jgi:uncharacterized protein involved in exopolysaccharide biosynthesis
MSVRLNKPERAYEEKRRIITPDVSATPSYSTRGKSVDTLRLVWSERRFLFRAALVGLLFATLIAFLIPTRFTSTARLMPPDQNSGTGMAMMAALASKAGEGLGSIGSQLLGLKTSGDLFIGILESRTVEDDLIRKFDLLKVYDAKRWEDARAKLLSRTAASQDHKSELITITVTDHSPQRAQQMAQEYIEELNRVVTNLNTSSAHRERVFLQDRLTQVQGDLESAEKDFSQFASKNTAIDIQAQGKAMIEAGASLEGQLIAAQTELEGLRQVFTNNNVRVREAQARVDELNRQLQKLGGKPASDNADQQNQQNQGQDRDQGAIYPTIRQLPVLGVPYADLYRRMKVQEAVYETLTKQFELAKVEEAKETPSVKVLDPPDWPEKKSFPPHLMIMFVGMMLALIAGTAWVLGREVWETTDSADPRKAFATEVWADVRASLPWNSTNGYHDSQAPKPVNWVRGKLRGLRDNPSEVGEHKEEQK